MLRRSGFLTIIVGLFFAGSVPVSFAANSRYQHGKIRKIKACIGIIGTTGEPPTSAAPPNPFPPNSPADPDGLDPARSPNPNPWLFYVLDQRKDVKPDGWEFINPAAPQYPTQAHITRWTGSIPALTAATPLKPDVGAYWEVTISQANYNRLAEMDVIYLPIARVPVMFTEEQRRVLAALADSGVAIWADWALDTPTQDGTLGGNENIGNPLTRTKNAFFTNMDLKTATGAAAIPAVYPTHPLLNAQYPLDRAQWDDIGEAYGANPPSANRVIETRAFDLQATMNFTAVVPTSAANPQDGAYVAAGRYGSGFVIGTAGNVGKAIADIVSPAADFSVARINGVPDLSRGETEDLKFAYNLVAWTTEVSSVQKDGRHTGQSNVAADGLIEQSNYPNLVPRGGGFATYPTDATMYANPSNSLLVNGLVIGATRWNNGGSLFSELSVWEANPNDDFDGAPGVDDGPQDYILGQNYDKVAALPLAPTAAVYGMTLGELPELAGAGSKGFVFIGGSGGVLSLPAPRAGIPLTWTPTPAAGLNMNVFGAPAFALLPGPFAATGARTEAKLYAGGVRVGGPFGATGVGRLAGIAVNDAGAMAQEWAYPPQSEPNRLGAVAGPIVTAQVTDTGTGAIDTMVLATSVSPNIGVGQGGGQGGEATGRVDGFVVATRADPLTFPVGNNASTANNPQAGRRFVSSRWVNIPPGQGQAPQARELLWDATKYYEVRVINKATNYVAARFIPGSPGFNILPDGTAGQVELPEPTMLNGLDVFRKPGTRNQWDLDRWVLLADYSVTPVPVDGGLAGEATIRPRFSPPTPYIRNNAQTVEPTGVAGGVSVGKDNLIYFSTGKGYMCAAEWRRGRPHFRWKIRGAFGDYAGDTGGRDQNIDPLSPAYLADYSFVASPAAGNRIVFASKGRGSGGTAYIFEPDATIRAKLVDASGATIPWTPGLAQEVVIRGDHGLGMIPNNPGIMANTQPFGRVQGQFTVDPDTGTATFLNMENFSLDLSDTANLFSPSQAAAIGVDTGNRPAVRIPWWFRNAPAGLPSTGTPGWAYIPIPLVAVYRPTAPNDSFMSGPVIAGEKIMLMGREGWLHELPLDPKSINPNFPGTGNGLSGFDLAAAGIRRVKNVAAGTGIPTLASPAVTQGLVVTNTPRGITMYGSPNIIIADSNRIVEASGNSTALASTDVVIKHRLTNLDFPIPTDPNGMLPFATERKAISRAASVKRLDRRNSLTGLFLSSEMVDNDPMLPIKESPDYAEESYLVADAGNNRVVEFNPAGKAIWECEQVFDPFGYLPPGETLKLSQPMDAQRWVETEVSGGQTYYVIHTLITDTGNTRVVEVVDKVRYLGGDFSNASFAQIAGQVASDGRPIHWYHVVVWASQTNAQGMKLRYRNAQRVFWPAANGSRIDTQATGVMPVAPFLPAERYLSYTMATVQQQQVTYPTGWTMNGYHRTYGGAPASHPKAVQDRKPAVQGGSDSIVFLRGHYNTEAPSGFDPRIREDYPMGGVVVQQDRYRYNVGVIDPTMPIISEMYDEQPGMPDLPIHRLNGVSSVQLTVRADIKFGAGTQLLPYLLIADTDGVWECRTAPGMGLFRMNMAFTVEDYAYVTGSGNGNPLNLYSTNPMDHTPGGRRLNAVSARRLASGQILITSRTPANEQPRAASNQIPNLNIGSDVFILRPTDYFTAVERGGAPYNRRDVTTHGWQPDQWLQQPPYVANIPMNLRGAPSIRWRAAEQLNPLAPPTLRAQFEVGGNPAELTGTYIPAQPNYADIAY